MMEGLAVKQASHAALLLEYGQPAQDAFISCLASAAHSQRRLPLQPAPDTCSSSPVDAWWHSAAMLGDWVQSSRSDHACSALVGHSRYPHGISTPTACLPAFALPTATTNKRNAMPGHCMRAEKHLRRTLHTPSSLCTCMLACQMM